MSENVATLILPLTRANPKPEEVTLCGFGGFDMNGVEVVKVEVTTEAIYLRATGNPDRVRVDLRSLCDAALRPEGYSRKRVST
jgi:hypothetical protein